MAKTSVEKEDSVASVSGLAESEERYKMIFDGVNEMIVFLDTHGRIIEANNKIKEIFGLEPQDVKGKTITSLGSFKIKDFSPIKSFSMIMGLVMGGKTIDSLQLETKDKNGNAIFLESSTSIIKKNGKNIGYLAVSRDITERKIIENALRERNEELEKLNKLSVGRELAMIELKRKITELESELAKAQGK